MQENHQRKVWVCTTPCVHEFNGIIRSRNSVCVSEAYWKVLSHGSSYFVRNLPSQNDRARRSKSTGDTVVSYERFSRALIKLQAEPIVSFLTTPHCKTYLLTVSASLSRFASRAPARATRLEVIHAKVTAASSARSRTSCRPVR